MATISNIVRKKTTSSATVDGILFNTIQHTGSANPTPHILNNNVWQASASSASNIPYAVNGVDINWNGAVLPNANISTGGSVTINTTGELLKLINDMQQEIYTLAAAVIAIGNKTDVVDIADYINTDKIMPKAALYTYNGLPISNMRWCVDDVNDKMLVFCTGYKNPQVEDPYIPTDAFYILFTEGGASFSGWEYCAQWSINEAPSWITDIFSE